MLDLGSKNTRITSLDFDYFMIYIGPELETHWDYLTGIGLILLNTELGLVN